MKIYTVTQFREELNELLAQATVVIEGEVAEFQVSQNKFVWFSLIDEETTIKCFMMQFQLHLSVENGMKVRVTGAPSVFKKGQLVFKPRSIEPVGDGSVQKAFEALKKKLQTEGLFDEGRKRALPEYPSRIAVVTSRDAAAYTDILRILRNRWSGIEILLMPVQVQGRAAQNSIVGAFAALRQVSNIDVIILARGGGSADDLAAFNTEDVARAIFAAHAPVVSAVGHERDTTIADLVADVRASTPSNAAERVVPDRVEMLETIDQYIASCEQRMQYQLLHAQRELNEAVHLCTTAVTQVGSHVTALEQRCLSALELRLHHVQRSQETIDQSVKLLESLNPLRVLDRGYTMTLNEAGKMIRSSKQVRSGEQIITRTASGTIESRVE